MSPTQRKTLGIAFIVSLAAAGTLHLGTDRLRPVPAFRVLTEREGIHRLSWGQLVDAGLPRKSVAAARIRLTHRGEPVPVRVDSADASFGRGDWIEFRAERLRGSDTHRHRHARYNVYRLAFAGVPSPRIAEATPASEGDEPAIARTRARHWERDRLMIRLAPRDLPADQEEPELWFWHKLTHIDRQPFSFDLDLDDLAPDARAPLELTIRFQALVGGVRRFASAERLFDHRVEVRWNGEPAGAAEWNGKTPHVLTLPAIEPERLRVGVNRIELEIPPRSVDVVMLDWIAARYPRAPRTADRPAVRPALVEIDRPSNLRAARNRADYLMIAHTTLIGAIEPLAAFHRRNGLAVEVVDVQDVYDEFGDGIVHPRAIRDFIAHAHSAWRAPRPRFVLLVGDASWDIENATCDDANYANWVDRELLDRDGRFVDNTERGVRRYRDPVSPGQRDLVPTWSFASYEGHAASDNFFVAVEGDDIHPDLAIGRLPVIDPVEVEAIVAKTIRYAAAARLGSWRRSILWIANQERSFQRRSARLAQTQLARGFAGLEVYPRPEEADNARHHATIARAFDQGQLLVHFYGHGGRHIWRTGPPDPDKDHDLFTLEHIDRLAANSRLPLVLSMTAYSAPFDHPCADSIGEKLLRAPARGAVAVFAASWRNSPPIAFSERLIEELTVPGVEIGTAIMRAKKRSERPLLIQTYNLLGDPALRLALPALEVEADLATDDPAAAIR